MAVDPSPLFTCIPEIVGVLVFADIFLLTSIKLSSTDSVVVFKIVSVPSTVKFPCILTPVSSTVNSILLFAVTTSFPVAPEPETVALVALLSVLIAVVDIPDIWSSTYFLLANFALALGAVSLSNVIELTPVIAFDDAVAVISPTSNPLLTLKFLVVMVPYLPHDC